MQGKKLHYGERFSAPVEKVLKPVLAMPLTRLYHKVVPAAVLRCQFRYGDITKDGVYFMVQFLPPGQGFAERRPRAAIVFVREAGYGGKVLHAGQHGQRGD
jgi:hypothetical protein